MIKAMPGEGGEIPVLSPARERALLRLLSAIQFTHILDFMIVMPLGPVLMDIFKITPAQFGIMVSAYTFSAGLFGLVAAWFLDRFDRKRALLFLYAGFGLGTLACALAPTYAVLLAARFLAGGFGGIAGATLLAVVGDVVPPARRGAAMGTVFRSFSLASIAGVPLGLFLANHLGWHAPFFLLAGLSAVILVLGQVALPSLRGHIAAVRVHAWTEMRTILSQVNHWRAFALTMVMTLAGFLVIPYISPSLVSNAGLAIEQLPYVYLCGGAATFFTMRWFGMLGDKHGLLLVFTVASLITIVPMIAISNLPQVPVWVSLAVCTGFMVFSSGRMVPGMAMVANSVEARYRGGFMSINSALQQGATGLAALVAAAIIGRTPDGRLTHYGIVGALGAASIVVSLVLAKNLKPGHSGRPAGAPAGP